MSGWDIASELRSIQPDLRVIICTGYVFKDSEESELAGVVLLMKPYDKNELASALHDLLD